MALETITGDLLAYKELEPGTFQHADQLTTERRTNPELRNQSFYTADGELYAFQKGKHLWAITREPQNLVLENIDEAYRQLRDLRIYHPNAEAAHVSLKHDDTVVIDLKGLELVKDTGDYGYFAVDPENIKKLNSEQKRAAQRIYGSDEDNFGLNMEMFAEEGKTPHVFVLMLDCVQRELRSSGNAFLARASWLRSFGNYSDFGAVGHDVDDRGALRGVRKIREADAPKNEAPQVPQETTEEKPAVVTLERMLELSRPHVKDSSWPSWEETLRKLYKQ